MLVAPCTGSQSSKRAHQDGDSASENASAETGLGEVSPSDTVGGSVIAGAGGFARDLDDFFPIKIHWGQLGVLEIGVPGVPLNHHFFLILQYKPSILEIPHSTATTG